MAFAKGTVLLSKLRYRLLLYLVVALVFTMPLRNALEQHFLYFPDPSYAATPARVNLDYEEITFSATDATQLHGWLVPGQTEAPAVLFCMGNAGNISHRLETLQLLHQLGVTVFIFNYRGYGTSEGRASEAGTYSDIAGAMAFLNDRGWPAERIILFGRSLGAAVSLEGSLRTTPAGLIMEAPFTSIESMGRHHYPLLNSLLGWLISAKYNNLAKIAELEAPLLIIHGKNDNICPPSMAEELYARAPQEKQILWIPEAGHNDGFVVGGERYRDTLKQVIYSWTGFKTEPVR
jgi:fermentation-respiration switch protein FrsA (DUF1100 family)